VRYHGSGERGRLGGGCTNIVADYRDTSGPMRPG
jgi:hypothetical protein